MTRAPVRRHRPTCSALIRQAAVDGAPAPGRDLARLLTEWVVDHQRGARVRHRRRHRGGHRGLPARRCQRLRAAAEPGAVAGAGELLQLSGRTAAFTVDRLLPWPAGPDRAGRRVASRIPRAAARRSACSAGPGWSRVWSPATGIVLGAPQQRRGPARGSASLPDAGRPRRPPVSALVTDPGRTVPATPPRNTRPPGPTRPANRRRHRRHRGTAGREHPRPGPAVPGARRRRRCPARTRHPCRPVRRQRRPPAPAPEPPARRPQPAGRSRGGSLPPPPGAAPAQAAAAEGLRADPRLARMHEAPRAPLPVAGRQASSASAGSPGARRSRRTWW